MTNNKINVYKVTHKILQQQRQTVFSAQSLRRHCRKWSCARCWRQSRASGLAWFQEAMPWARPLCLSPQDDAQSYRLRPHEQPLFMQQDREATTARHTLYMAGGTGTSGLRDRRPLRQPRKERKKQHLLPIGPAVGRSWLHLAWRGVYRWHQDRVQGQQVHFRVAQDGWEEPGKVTGQSYRKRDAYCRFRHFAKDKVTMHFAFFAIAFNIKKMCSKMATQARNRGK